MSNVLDLMPRLEASRARQRASSTEKRFFVSAGQASDANFQLLSSAAALGFDSIAEMSAYWLKLAALAEIWTGEA